MCTNPIHIKNKKFKSLNLNFSHKFISVPCGCCDECLRKRAKDIFCRARFQIEDDLLSGGSAFMCCLTYKICPDLSKYGYSCFVFNKQHVINFIKRLRTNLDRFYMKHFSVYAPDFKYLITSEYGSDPTRTHRPHYHLLISFSKSISYYVFRLNFIYSLTNHKTNSSDFGYVVQCEPLDIKKGGVRYSSKYILKDLAFNNQAFIIKELLNFYKSYVNQKHGIIEFEKNSDDVFFNKCIRSSKAYKNDVSSFVSPVNHCKQFYMCSNDYGISSILRRYGESLFSLSVLNIDGYPYSIPKQVLQRLERIKGSKSKNFLTKSIFLSSLKVALSTSVLDGYIDNSDCDVLYSFAKNFVIPKFGSLYLDNDCLEDYGFNAVFYLYKINDILKYANNPEKLAFRSKVAALKNFRERQNYISKKKNKSI